MADPIATIIMPTLEMDRAAETCKLAKQTAGVDVSFVILWDYKPRGAVKLSNALFKAALHMQTPYVVYLNDDVIPKQQDWLKLMIRGLEVKDKFGMACCGGECSTTPQRTAKPGDPYKVIVVNKPLAWFCAVVKRQVFLDVGLFDECFIHYGDESDWLKRAFNAGWKQVYIQGVYMRHLRGSGGENSKLRNRWARQDKRLYRKRWVKKIIHQSRIPLYVEKWKPNQIQKVEADAG